MAKWIANTIDMQITVKADRILHTPDGVELVNNVDGASGYDPNMRGASYAYDVVAFFPKDTLTSVYRSKSTWSV